MNQKLELNKFAMGFPATYKTQSGDVVEMAGVVLIGEARGMIGLWTVDGKPINFLRLLKDQKGLELIELITSPIKEPKGW